MSATYIERSRSGCALHGALATLGAIEGIVPIVHSTAGCGIQYQQGITPFGGAVPNAASWGPPLSSSNISEKHVVFGGGSRLREQLKNTVKVVKGDLYVVVTGCSTEMVGDDIRAMTKEGREQGFPVVCANTPGFGGSIHRGYELAVRTLIEQLPELTAPVSAPSAAPRSGAVNLWGVVPQQDVFWQGHLLQLERLLGELWIPVNPLLGFAQNVESWRQVPHAALNLVVSPWGREAAQLLQLKYGTPWAEIPGLPVGPQGTERLLAALAKHLPLDSGLVHALRQRHNSVFERHLTRLAPIYFSAGFQREFSIVGELALVSGVTEFLAGTLGLIPKLAIVTDPLPEEEREDLSASLRQVLAPFQASLAFSEDAGEIADLLRASDSELVIGSSLERTLADELNTPFLAISFPLAGRLVLERGYVGCEGALALVEDLGTAILGQQQAKAIANGFS